MTTIDRLSDEVEFTDWSIADQGTIHPTNYADNEGIDWSLANQGTIHESNITIPIANVTNLQSELDSTNLSVSANTTSINTNTSSIATNASDIAALQASSGSAKMTWQPIWCDKKMDWNDQTCLRFCEEGKGFKEAYFAIAPFTCTLQKVIFSVSGYDGGTVPSGRDFQFVVRKTTGTQTQYSSTSQPAITFGGFVADGLGITNTGSSQKEIIGLYTPSTPPTITEGEALCLGLRSYNTGTTTLSGNPDCTVHVTLICKET